MEECIIFGGDCNNCQVLDDVIKVGDIFCKALYGQTYHEMFGHKKVNTKTVLDNIVMLSEQMVSK